MLTPARCFVLLIVSLLAVIALTASASAEPSVDTQKGGVEVVFSGGFSPRHLPEVARVPISLHVDAEIRTAGGSSPPLRTMIFRTDDNGALLLRRVPRCNPNLQSNAHCELAALGHGVLEFEAESAEGSKSIFRPHFYIEKRSNKLLWGIAHIGRDGSPPTTLYFRIAINSIDHGPYSTQVTISIPRLVYGHQLVLNSFSATLTASTYPGPGTVYPFRLRCPPSGNIASQAEAIFADALYTPHLRAPVRFANRRTCRS
jgi:hypothetical protein